MLAVRMGYAHQTRGEYAAALSAYESSLRQAELSGHTTYEGESHVSLSGLYMDLGDYGRAATHARNALSIFEATGDRLSACAALDRVAWAANSSDRDMRPNILFIMTDQQHVNMLSCTGNSWLPKRE